MKYHVPSTPLPGAFPAIASAHRGPAAARGPPSRRRPASRAAAFVHRHHIHTLFMHHSLGFKRRRGGSAPSHAPPPVPRHLCIVLRMPCLYTASLAGFQKAPRRGRGAWGDGMWASSYRCVVYALKISLGFKAPRWVLRRRGGAAPPGAAPPPPLPRRGAAPRPARAASGPGPDPLSARAVAGPRSSESVLTRIVFNRTFATCLASV